MSKQDVLRIAIRRFEPFESAIQKQFASFKQATGCSLELEFASLDLNPLYESLFTKRGLKDGTWDIAFLVTDWLAEAIQTGALTDISSWMKTLPLPDYPQGWSPGLTQAQQVGSAIYGIPYHDGPECFVYRKDLFEDSCEQTAFEERFGYPLAPPRTWAQFYDIAHFFTRPEQDLYGTIFAAYPDGHNAVYDFCLQLWGRGGEFSDPTGNVTLDLPQAVAALDFYRQIVNDRTATYPDPQEIDSVKSGELFAAGKAAMMVNWFGFAAVCEVQDCPAKGKVAIAPLPSGDGYHNVSLSAYWLLTIGAGSRHKDEAYAFLRHICSPAMDKLTTLEGAIGCRLSTWTDPEVNAIIPFYHQLVDLYPHTRVMPNSSALPRLFHVIDTAVQQALTTNESSAAILRRAQSQAAALTL